MDNLWADFYPHNWSNGRVPWYTVAPTYIGQVSREEPDVTGGTKGKPDNAFYLRLTISSARCSTDLVTLIRTHRLFRVISLFCLNGYSRAPWQALLDDSVPEDSSAQQHNTPEPVQHTWNYSATE